MLGCTIHYIRLILVFFVTLNMVQAGSKNYFDDHYNATKHKRDRISYPNRRRTQLYSRHSGKHVQVLQTRGKVVAKGISGDRYAGLVILTVSFGKVQIKGVVTDRYICFDKRGHLISKRRPTGSRCIFKEKYGKDAFTQYESAKLKGRFLAFNKNGNPRNKVINKSGRKSAQFVERPRPRTIKKPGYYRGKSRRISERTMNRHKKLALKQAKKFRIELPSGLLEGSGQLKQNATKNDTKPEEYEVRPKTKRNKNRFYKGESRRISQRNLNQHKKLALKNANKMGIMFPTPNSKLSLKKQNEQKRQGRHTGKDEERMVMQRENDGSKNTKIGRKTSQQNLHTTSQRNGWESQSSSNGTFRIDHG